MWRWGPTTSSRPWSGCAERGVRFQDTPDTYYEQLDARVPGHGERPAAAAGRQGAAGRGADRGPGAAAADLHREHDRADLLRVDPAQRERGLRGRATSRPCSSRSNSTRFAAGCLPAKEGLMRGLAGLATAVSGGDGLGAGRLGRSRRRPRRPGRSWCTAGAGAISRSDLSPRAGGCLPRGPDPGGDGREPGAGRRRRGAGRGWRRRSGCWRTIRCSTPAAERCSPPRAATNWTRRSWTDRPWRRARWRGVTHTKHPISLARAVMEHSGHVMLIGEGAEAFGKSRGLEAGRPRLFLH